LTRQSLCKVEGMSIVQKLFTPACLNCHSLFVGNSLLCANCEALLVTELERHHRRAAHWPVRTQYYLIPWKQDSEQNSELLQRLVYRLKNNQSPAAWKFYAQLTIRLLPSRGLEFDRYRLLVPLAGRNDFGHAHHYAYELGRLLNKPVLDLLKSTGQKQQKLKSRAERKEVRFQLASRQAVHFTKILFIDDLLTTGESYRQARQLFTGPSDNTPADDSGQSILTLFYRYAKTNDSAIHRP